MPADEAMSPSQIARLWGVSHATAGRHTDKLGEPVNPGAARPRYTRKAAIEAGRLLGYLDGRGRPVERKEEIRPTRPIPLPFDSPATGKRLYFVPDVAAMFGMDHAGVHQWVTRRVLPKGGDEPEITGKYPAWHMSTLRDVAKRVRRPFNDKAKRA
ncbi:hypothetical protein ACWD2L_00595 [Streptomyces sp. NPDC002754]